MSERNLSTNDLHDRVTDRLLAEAVGGETPPDLREAILSRGQSGAALAESKPARWRWVSLAIAACLLVGISVGLLPNGLQEADQVAINMPADASKPPMPKQPFTAEQGNRERSSAVADGESFSSKSESMPTEEASGASFGKSARGGVALADETPDSLGLGRSEGVDTDRLQRGLEAAEGVAAKPARTPSAISSGATPALESPSYSGRTPASSASPASPPFVFSADSYGRELKGRVDLRARQADQAFSWQHLPGIAGGDRYAAINENPFVLAQGAEALSTFSIDVDTASYANVRQFLQQRHQLPPADAVRIEELVNYFDYAYEAPAAESEVPFAANLEVADCPWNARHRLVRIGIKGREVLADKRPLSNLVFLVDVSGSMNEPNKLPLLVAGLKRLVRQLGENDRVALVVYASSEGLALPSTSGADKPTILAALDRLTAGGSTAGGAGIQLAYQTAEENFITGGMNRVLLCTDGDFNVGLTGDTALGDLVETKARETGVFLSVLGFGRGNLNDAMMETISGRGNGVYAYIDSDREAHRVLVRQMSGTLVTIAKDVKLQVEFNPQQVARYRLVGYENRLLAAEDFNDDQKDAGEIGAGHTVTALYEIVPTGLAEGVDPLKYQQEPAERSAQTAKADAPELPESPELLTLKIRYKQPDGDTSTKLEFPLVDEEASLTDASADFQFASAVAEFGLLLRNSQHRGAASYDAVLQRAESNLGDDPHGDRAEFLGLVREAKRLSQQ
ncbi:YfbK domain-containing protein [Botrimarina hoheduenensis]|uniref:von Willebrand factor n=1 Tax=Botrimarina hoheduenensis TaxID=2528000 RepID=A0A5C5VYC4_9BACT|nr:von Willebrand factor type A domain-containing protein [Botrimarina hoheduenensis]TWT42741.1 von Willebrand factor [Botrimarina hoheduenensis]